MSTRTTTLALEVVSEVDDAVSGLDRVETAAEGVTGAMAKLEAANDQAGRAIGDVTDKADGLDAAGGALTGALGALSSGFELIGAEKAAESLQAAGLATDFLSGVGQTAALAVKGQAAATQALATAQKVANAAMRANPIGLVVTAILLLVGGLVLAYNKSETFRNIVQDAGRKGKAAFDAVTDAVSVVVGWVRDKIPPAFGWFKDKAAAVVKPARDAVSNVKDAADDVLTWVGKIPAKFGELKDKAVEIAGPLLAPFTAVKDALEWIADKLDNLKMPAWLDKIPGVGRFTASSYDVPAMSDWSVGDALGRTSSTTPTPPVVIQVQGALDPYAVAVQVRDLLGRYGLAVTGV